MLDTAPDLRPAASDGDLGAQASDLGARVRLGASADTAPDVLMALARDSAVTVRAAVAMNPAAPRQLDRVLAADGDERVRTLLARRLALLIPGLPSANRDQLQEQALATLSELVEDTATRVRAAIAEAVKDMPQVPRALILRLACDAELSVCGPVIRLSPLLTAEDLLAMLASPRSSVTATAIAHRQGLSETVSDVIAASTDAGAITALLRNPTAAIRESTLDGLIGRAATQLEWHAPLVRRPSLSARATRALSEIVGCDRQQRRRHADLAALDRAEQCRLVEAVFGEQVPRRAHRLLKARFQACGGRRPKIGIEPPPQFRGQIGVEVGAAGQFVQRQGAGQPGVESWVFDARGGAAADPARPYRPRCIAAPKLRRRIPPGHRGNGLANRFSEQNGTVGHFAAITKR